MNSTTNDAPFKLFNFGKSNDYTQQVNTESPRPTGITHDGKDIADLTDDGTQGYHVKQNVQPKEIVQNPYKISITERRLVKIEKEELHAKWDEIGYRGEYTLPSFLSGKEKLGCEIFNPKMLIFWGLLITWIGCVIVPLVLFITSNPTNPIAGNVSKIVGFGCWLAFGTLAAGALTIYCYYRDKLPTQYEIEEKKSTLKHGDIYNMYHYLNNAILDDKLGIYKSKRNYYQPKINNWFENYSKKIKATNLTAEEKAIFYQLFNSHKAMLSNLMANHNASWVDNEPIMAENLKCLLCSENENCSRLAEKWATEFIQFGRAL